MNIRPVSFAVVVALAAIAASAVLVDVEVSTTAGSARAVPAVDRPIAEGQRTSEPTEPARALQSNAEGAQVRDWTRRYHESTDDFLLARELVPAALAGDGSAQHQLGRLILRCEVYKRILAPYTDGSVADRVEFHLASGNLAEQARTQFRRGALRCARLLTEDPFAAYDLPEEAADFRYWAERAVQSGDPVAVMSRAFAAAVGHSRTDDDNAERAFREGVLSDVRRVVFSGNGAALYTLGGLFSHPSVASDPDDGYAWTVVACESGYDCSNANPDIGVGCVERGSCEPGGTFLDVLQRDLGPGKYAGIYAKAQDIQYKIGTNDWDGLQQYLEIK